VMQLSRPTDVPSDLSTELLLCKQNSFLVQAKTSLGAYISRAASTLRFASGA
jgi:hypothetical protein